MPSGGKDLGSCCALSKSSCLGFVILIHSFVNLPMNTTTEDFHFSVFVLIYRDFCSCSIQLLIGARLSVTWSSYNYTKYSELSSCLN